MNKELQIRNTKFFFFFFLLFEIIGFILLFVYSKPEIQIEINKLNTHFTDVFFKYITHFGSGYLCVVLFVVVLFYSRKNAAVVGLSSVLMLGIVQSLKSFVFAERPVSYFTYSFKTNYVFHFVEGVKIHYYSSFPSGHTAAAFTFFLLLAMLVGDKNKILQILFFILALLVGYSRMYLMQHFLIDVLVGAAIGIFCVYVSVLLINNIIKKYDNKKN